jgi:segregation and condensation protein A
MYELKLEKFSGPLEKLLELIEEQKLDVNEVSMAKVTDDFLAYLDTFRKEGTHIDEFRADLRLLADFVAVASRLIFLKSKYLLPNLPLTMEEEADIKDLEARLVIYRDLRPAFKVIGKLWREGHRAYSRPYFLGRGAGLPSGQSVFYPGGKTDVEGLTEAIRHIFEEIKIYEREEETIQGTIVTLEEKIQEVLSRIEKGGDSNLNQLSGEKSRAEMIVVFLAVLHLAREQLVRLEQIGNFSDIMVKKNG